MKAVLISIQPKWCELIASGKKTIEVRKTRPKIKTPFKCYIYCTIGNGAKGDYLVPSGIQCGKVIGEFVCDKVFDIQFTKPFLYYGKKMFHSNNCCKEACLSYVELEDYLGSKDGYGWHISDLTIYDKAKSIEMFPVGKIARDCGCGGYMIYNKVLARPPQSWCYVEELEVEE